MSLVNGIPSHDRFARVFTRLDPEQMQTYFICWIQAISQLSTGEIIAIEGKTVRHSYDGVRRKGSMY